MPVPGEFFERKYQIVRVLGTGGFASVFLARDAEVQRDVAIKILTPGGAGYTDQIASRFMREARVIASLQDAHTITMFEFGRTASGLLFMVFEYVSGEDLAAVLRQHGALDTSTVEHIVRQILSALAEAHQRGVLHRDIKPANVLVFPHLDDVWRVKLIDFGIAKPLISPGGRDFTQLTAEGTVVGTPRYMAPEQFYGDDLTPRADIYAVGLIAYEMLVGRPANEGSEADALRGALSMEPHRLPPFPEAPVLVRVIERMLERAPDARFATAAAVLSALDAPQEDRAPHTPSSVSMRRRTLRDEPVSEHPTAGIWGAAALGMGAVAILGAAFFLTRDDGPSEVRARAVQVPNALIKVAEPLRARLADVGNSSTTSADGGAPDLSRDPLAGGCGKPLRWRGTRTRDVPRAAEPRRFTLHVPRTYDPNVKHRVVMIFHNALTDGRSVIRSTEFDNLADREGLVLIALDALDSARPWYRTDDVELTHRVLDEATNLLCLDRSHVYALGHGGGGNYAVRLRCELPLSAIAISGTGDHVDTEICESEPTPFLRFYGTKDRHVPWKGGRGCFDPNEFRSAKEIERQWRARNRTSARGQTWTSDPGGTCTLWSGDAAVVSCRLDGGHDWPNGQVSLEIPGCAAPPPKFPMATTVWRFFDEHGRDLDQGAIE